MNVVTGRVRCAYSIKRTRRRVASAIAVLLLVLCAYGFASKDDEAASKALASDFTQSYRNSIVASWYIPEGE